MSSSVNPAGNDDLSVQYNVASDTVNREPPPPYSPSANNAVDNQPTSIIHQTIIVQAPLKDAPMFYICPRCQDRILTKVEYVSSKGTHMLAGFVCGLTLQAALSGAILAVLVKTALQYSIYFLRNNLGIADKYSYALRWCIPSVERLALLVTRWCCLCCLAALPYYFQTFKKAQHFCPNCNELLGTYSKI